MGPGAKAEEVNAAPLGARAGGAITLGEVGNGTLNCMFTPPYGVVADPEDPTRSSYIAPFRGVVTSYSTFSNFTFGSVRLLVLKAGADATHKVLVGKSELEQVGEVGLHTWSVSMPVKAGERIGLGLTVSGLSCWSSIPGSTDVLRVATGFDPDISTNFAYAATPFPAVRPNVSAVLEPDVDGDGFGDVTQDLCPGSATTQAACPVPDVIVSKAPKKKSSERKAKIRFTSTVPGSTFMCAIDGRSANPCTSPFKKRFRYGKHVVVISAFNPVGLPDPTPAIVRFKIKKP